ncbi:hypothetical protein DFH94DRAFT_133441 [Russula ochroleuca]|uniref:LSM2-LSM8 complex subunit LSM8 n=1 Tax=Russula ochroleuca TaxID=152965 RepID=A0A9P5K290_9AGAM|nr:hypothetical protein DFH94DRAFT_85700 [Russula ochroleuca]KAF8474495.1 hypothetical protein DFH94DRAFT_133441 [Russula ochroleuca]
MSSLQGYIDRRVLLVLQDGRAIVVAYLFPPDFPPSLPWFIPSFLHSANGLFLGIQGVLAGYDQKSNVVLSDSKERIYSIDEGVEEVPLGLYLVKGDMIILIGEIDEERDRAIDLSTIRADPVAPIRY